MAIEKELLDRLLAGRDPNEVFSRDGLLDDLKKALSERILNTELDEHLDDEREAGGPGNRRNGRSKKTVLTGTSKMQLSIPRDRAGTFDPKLIAKYQRRFPEFDDKIISMYARGMSVREIRWRSGLSREPSKASRANSTRPPTPTARRIGRSFSSSSCRFAVRRSERQACLLSSVPGTNSSPAR
jgi:putative transposase